MALFGDVWCSNVAGKNFFYFSEPFLSYPPTGSFFFRFGFVKVSATWLVSIFRVAAVFPAFPPAVLGWPNSALSNNWFSRATLS